MSVADVSGKAIANLATEELTHPAPVFHGDTLYAESEVLEVRTSKKPDRGVVKVRTDVYNQRNELVATLPPRRAGASPHPWGLSPRFPGQRVDAAECPRQQQKGAHFLE